MYRKDGLGSGYCRNDKLVADHKEDVCCRLVVTWICSVSERQKRTAERDVAPGGG